MKKAFKLIRLIFVVVVILILARVVYLYLNYQGFQFNGSSMLPTLKSGQTVMIKKNLRQIERGDIVLFTAPEVMHCPPDTGCDFVKRVIAIPGDRVMIQDNSVYLNGIILEEPYLSQEIITKPASSTQFLPEGKEAIMGNDEFFVMGDNRGYSSDSRQWGPLEKKYIKGVVEY